MFLLVRAGWSGQEPVDGGVLAQLGDWTDAMFRITQGWRWDHIEQFRYDMHTWTLPVEMSMSMLLFVTMTGLSRCKSSTRLVLMVAAMAYCFLSSHWAGVEFMGGAFIAEIDLIEQDKRSYSPSVLELTRLPEYHDDQSTPESDPTSAKVPKPPRWRGIALAVFWWSQLIVALFLCGWPNKDVEQAPGLAWLAEHSPEPYYSWGLDGGLMDWRAAPWYILASLQIVFACQQLPPLQRFLSTGPIQYLASISFALYLVHGPVQDSLGKPVTDAVWDFAGVPGGRAGVREETASFWQLFFVWTAGVFGLGIPSVWLADLFWRYVDRPCVDFARWMDRRCVGQEQ